MNKKSDDFANIAAGGINTKGKDLYRPEPENITIKPLPMSVTFEENRIIFPQKMSTKEELTEELERWKEKYKPFLSRQAPGIKNYREKTELVEFEWKIEEAADRKNVGNIFSGEKKWEKVTIPHFGEPLGKAVTYYRTEFDIREVKETEAAFIHFDGVDYEAHVFVNQHYLGSHEGFFAPFEFDMTPFIKEGKNQLVVKVENDFVLQGSYEAGSSERIFGDKIYAATGPGYDDPAEGWHHCPPGMGIYQDVYIEIRSRSFIQDIFVRPLPEENKAEAWIEAFKCDPGAEQNTLKLSLYGRNFKETIFEDRVYIPTTSLEVGMGDTFTKANLTASGEIDKPSYLFMEKGLNYFKIPFDLENYKEWNPETPYLYELQVKLVDPRGNIIDERQQSFGMRSFTMDVESTPKGGMYLNGEFIKLRGANTMGNEQQCVMKGDYDQLLEDLLLARICNMNFLRLTQRPVQDIVYEYCDMLGLMTQTDLPLFGVLRTNQFAEAIRQTEEMEKIVRKHPCNIMVSYINEPFPNAFNKPHRFLNRTDLMAFFEAADIAVKINNPDRVIKHVDGDYDPPSESLPDNHCYTTWYNGHGVDKGELHKGYWIPVKKDWYYGCGEYGAEGLDPIDVMRKYYPKSWLPQSADEEVTWSPNSIVRAQTGNFHYFFYESQNKLEDWIEESRNYQEKATKLMTEAFRRNKNVVTSAIHLFIDAFPSGWMKVIMDVDRNPKPAYFAYRDALTPLMVSLRTDKYSYASGDKASVEVWLCNDTPKAFHNAKLYYEVLLEDKLISSGEKIVSIDPSDSRYYGSIEFDVPQAEGKLEVKAAILDKEDVLHDNVVSLKVYKNQEMTPRGKISIIGNSNKAKQLVEDNNLKLSSLDEINEQDLILIDDMASYLNQKEEIDKKVNQGAKLILLELDPGEYEVADTAVKVKQSGMLPLHFVARNTGHELVKGFEKDSFSDWFDPEFDRITPILENTFTSSEFTPILTSGNTNDKGEWGKVIAAGEYSYGKGKVIICQVKLAGRTGTNPVAYEFTRRLFK